MYINILIYIHILLHQICTVGTNGACIEVSPPPQSLCMFRFAPPNFLTTCQIDADHKGSTVLTLVVKVVVHFLMIFCLCSNIYKHCFISIQALKIHHHLALWWWITLCILIQFNTSLVDYCTRMSNGCIFIL